jgi:acylphosphatase
VQGVFFRDSTRRQAEKTGVAGWVRNRGDGTVEAVFEGDDDAVTQIVDWVRQGPGHAEVERLEVTEEEPEGISGFQVR